MKRHKGIFRLTALALASAFVAAGAVHAADSKLERGDERFVKRAAQSGKLEIDASRLALERAESPQVKEFAQKMIADHGAVDTELKALAQSKGVELPTDLRWGQSRVIKSLQDETGRDFDEEYIEKVGVDAHEDAVDLFKDAAEDASDADVKAFAAKHLPALNQHLQMAQQLHDALENDGDRSDRGDRALRGSASGTPPAPAPTPTAPSTGAATGATGASATTGAAGSAGSAGETGAAAPAAGSSTAATPAGSAGRSAPGSESSGRSDAAQGVSGSSTSGAEGASSTGGTAKGTPGADDARPAGGGAN